MAEELTLRNVNRLSTQQLRAELSKRNIDPDPENAGSGTKRPKSEDIISFQPGLLIKIQNIPLAYNCSSSSDVSIKSCIKGSCGGLKFVEMLTGLCAILRFATTEEASTAYGKLSRCEIALPFDSTGTHINILSGQDEVDYWSRIAEKHSKKRNEAEIHQVLLKRLMHVLAQEEKAKLQPEQKPVMCSECQAVLSSKSALARHMRVHVGGASGDSISSESYSIQDALVMGKMSFITVFEDDYMKVIVKPQGIATMGAKGEITVLTSDELLLSPTSRLYSSKYKKAVPVHRLDKLTGGLLVCSKTKVSERFLKQCFQNRLVGKKYRAICPGEILPREGVIDIPIGGKESITTYSVSHVTRSERFGWLTTVDLWPTTGRTHQLRIHLQSIGHPILGDPLYSPVSQAVPDEKLYLWSIELNLPAPLAYLVDHDDAAVKAADIGALSSDSLDTKKMLTINIDEPSFYSELRCKHEEAWQKSKGLV